MDPDKKKDLDKLTPIVDGLKIMESNAGWKWLSKRIKGEREKKLDILLGRIIIKDSNINMDSLKGEIVNADSIFTDIEFIKNQHKKLMEE